MSGFWKKLWQLLDLSHKKFKVLFFWLFLFECINLVGPYFLKLIIDGLVSFDVEKVQTLLLLIVGMFISEQIGSLVSYIRDRLIFNTLIEIEYYLPVRAQQKLVSLSLSYHERENTGNKIVIKTPASASVSTEESIENDGGHIAQLEDFYSAIRNGTKPKSTFKEGCTDFVTLVDAIEHANILPKLNL